MKDFSKLQLISVALAVSAFGYLAAIGSLEALGAFVAGCILVGFVAFLERKRTDEIAAVRKEIKELGERFESVLLSRGLRK